MAALRVPLSRLGGGCQLANFPAFRHVGKSESWRVWWCRQARGWGAVNTGGVGSSARAQDLSTQKRGPVVPTGPNQREKKRNEEGNFRCSPFPSESPSPRYRVKGKRNKCKHSKLKVRSSMKAPNARGVASRSPALCAREKKGRKRRSDMFKNPPQ